MVPSDGIQSRQYTKAVVLQGPDGTKAAVVKVDSWLQQQVLTRRVAELVSGADPLVRDHVVDGLDGDHLVLASTHNHSAPYYTSTAWGTWLFTDVLDPRMFEATARRIAAAIHAADAARVPARLGASVAVLDTVQQNIIGRSVADDGTPAGFPRDHNDPELTVVRVERLDGTPIAGIANFGMHPESIGTTDLMSADFVGVVEREVERALGRTPASDQGPVLVWTQGSVGDSEPDRNRANPAADGRDFWRRDYQQMERMSLDVAAAVLRAWRGVSDGASEVAGKHAPLAEDVPVAMVSRRFSGPLAHPVPTLSNCRTEHPALPIVGLPDCARASELPYVGEPLDHTASELLHELDHHADELGVPLPENVGVPMTASVPEGLQIHLQALALGEVLLATCPCEPVADMVRNLKSRTDTTSDNLDNGWRYPCQDDGTTVRCDFRDARWRPADWREVDRHAFEVMRAQVGNDAAGWEEDLATLQGEAEPDHAPAEIKGNFTHEEIEDELCADTACPGFTIPVMVARANDYIGYVVTPRRPLVPPSRVPDRCRHGSC